MRISDWSSDVCSSDLGGQAQASRTLDLQKEKLRGVGGPGDLQPAVGERAALDRRAAVIGDEAAAIDAATNVLALQRVRKEAEVDVDRSEERRVGKEGVSKCRSGGPQYH